MGVKVIILSLTVLGLQMSQTYCQRVVSGNMVASILQDILSPGNTQNALQLLQMAAAGSNRQIAVPEIMMPNRIMTKPIETAVPVRKMISREVMPGAYISREMEQPRIMSKLEVMPVRNDMPACIMPSMVKTMPEVVPRQYMQPMVEPCPMCQGLTNYARLPPTEVLPAMNPSLVSPYLPISSPVSAFAPPSSNMLPPPTQARNQYLRKIPIPPPTL